MEDTALSLSDVEARFGKEVATIVDGVTKLGKVKFSSATELQVENYRKMLLSIRSARRRTRRASGEEYVSHTVEVATILATLRLDGPSIIAGLIHDIVEDTALSLSDVETRLCVEVPA